MAHDGGERGAGSLLSRMQHGLFVLLTGIGLARALTTGAALAPVLLGVTLLLGWYAAGLALARRTDTNLAIWWLLGLTAVWLGLVLVSSEFVWVAVSLWLLYGGQKDTPLPDHLQPRQWLSTTAVASSAAPILVEPTGW